MSREGAPANQPKPTTPPAGTPIWVWAVYALGIFAASIVVFSVLFTIGGLYLSEEGDEFGWKTSVRGFVVWGGLMALAVGLWIWRRRKSR